MKFLTRVFKESSQVESEELHESAIEAGALDISNLKSGDIGKVFGIVNCVIVNPTSSANQFEFELFDGTDRLRVIYLGQKSILGIQPGIKLELVGRVVSPHHQKTMYNPEYRIIKD